MKNILYGTTALFAVGLLAGTAVAADRIKLGLGGYWTAMIQVGSNDDDSGASSGLRDHGLGQESEIYFSGRTTLDNGITFGVNVDLEGETSADQMDNSRIFASGAFGRVEYGETWGPALMMSYGGVGEKTRNGDFASHNAGRAINGLGLNSFSGGAGVNQIPSEKIIYYTPRTSGFQVGVSYSPERKNASANGARDSEEDGNVGNEMLNIAANYTSKYGGTDVGIFGSWFASETEPTAAVAAVGAITGSAGDVAGSAAVPAAADVDGWGFGAQFSNSGFRVGGRYAQLENFAGAGLDRTNWRIGVDYGMGPWSIGVTYQVASQDRAISEDETRYLSVGATYGIGPGVTFFGGIINYDHSDDANAAASEGENTFGIMGTRLSF